MKCVAIILVLLNFVILGYSLECPICTLDCEDPVYEECTAENSAEPPLEFNNPNIDDDDAVYGCLYLEVLELLASVEYRVCTYVDVDELLCSQIIDELTSDVVTNCTITNIEATASDGTSEPETEIPTTEADGAINISISAMALLLTLSCFLLL